LAVPERFTWVPEAVRDGGPAYDVGQMWVKFAEAIRTGSKVEPDSTTRCAATACWTRSNARRRPGNAQKVMI
jgi:hypothetical protein